MLDEICRQEQKYSWKKYLRKLLDENILIGRRIYNDLNKYKEIRVHIV